MVPDTLSVIRRHTLPLSEAAEAAEAAEAEAGEPEAAPPEEADPGDSERIALYAALAGSVAANSSLHLDLALPVSHLSSAEISKKVFE